MEYSRELNLNPKVSRSRHELECNVLNEVVIEEGYVHVTMRVEYKDIWMKKKSLRVLGTRYK